MSEHPAELPALDDPPRSGVWVEHDTLELTEEEIAEGNRLAAAIDPDDDHDNGTPEGVPR